jgi:hypothetical protein
MVRLADISALRDWVTVTKDDELVNVDVLDLLWYLEKLRLSYRAPSDVVDEAIGKYQADRFKSWVRTFNPLYWFGRLIDWLIGEAFNIVRLFGRNPETARRSPTGRKIFAIGQFIVWAFGLAAAVVTVLEFPPIRNFFH